MDRSGKTSLLAMAARASWDWFDRKTALVYRLSWRSLGGFRVVVFRGFRGGVEVNSWTQLFKLFVILLNLTSSISTILHNFSTISTSPPPCCRFIGTSQNSFSVRPLLNSLNQQLHQIYVSRTKCRKTDASVCIHQCLVNV